MAKAQGLAETLAGEVLDEATDRNTELWDEYPDLHDLTYGRQEQQSQGRACEAVRKLDEAVAEARRHGVKLAAGGGIPGRQPGGTVRVHRERHPGRGQREGSAAALFRSAAQEAGVAGAAGMESTEWLDVLMNVHDTIKPKMMSRFADAAEYEDAKGGTGGPDDQRHHEPPEMTDAEAVFEGHPETQPGRWPPWPPEAKRAAEVTKGLKSEQQAQRKAFADRMRETAAARAPRPRA